MLPTIVRCRVRSTQSSTTCPSSRTAIRDSCFVALITISRDMRPDCRLLPMGTTIYFSGSISGGREDVETYRAFVAALEEAGHRVFAGMVTAKHVGADGEPLSAGEIFARDIAWMEDVARSGGVLVAEVSRPSTGVGYEIAFARHRLDM